MTPERFEGLNARGDALRADLGRRFARSGLDATVTGAGSLFNVHLGLAGSRSADARAAVLHAFHVSMLNDGYYLAPRGMGALSTPMTQADIDGLADAVERHAHEVLSLVDVA